MKILDRYILRSHLPPFLLGFLVTTGFLFTQVLRSFLDDFLAKGIGPITILEFFLLSLGHTLALSVPMAVLIAVVMSFSQMAHYNEITALKASGIHLYRIMAPVLLTAVVLTVLMFLFNNYVLPESNHRLAGLITDISRKKPTVSIEPGIIVDDYTGYQLYIGDKNEAADQILDVQVIILDPDRPPKIVVAPVGRLRFEDGGNTLHVDLYDGEMHAIPKKPGSTGKDVYQITHFKEHSVTIANVGNTMERTERKYRSDREMRVSMLRARIQNKFDRIEQWQTRVNQQGKKRIEAKLSMLDPERRKSYFETHSPPRPGKLSRRSERNLSDTANFDKGTILGYQRQIRSLQVEVHKKFAIPMACIVFVLCGAPLAIASGRSGTTMAVAFSLGIFLIYYLFLTEGEKLADRQLLSPGVAMWGANIVFSVIGIALTRLTVNETKTLRWGWLNVRNLFSRRQHRAS